MEDILSTDQRPKFEEYDDHIYIVLRMMQYNEKRHLVGSEQLSLVFGKNFVLSFQESKGDLFDMVRERIRKAESKIRKRGADYIAYALIDAVVDGYFLILEHFSDDVERLETEMSTTDEVIHRINVLKREAIYLRRTVWPLRDAIGSLMRSDNTLITKGTHPYLRDLHDHTVQIIDNIETLRDMVSGMMELHMTRVSNRTNDVMKVLTIIATIFIPLTFIAGIYGMNFRYMPELTWRYGYFVVLGIMLIILLLELWYFKRKGWM
jgi:magnesium transporter